MRLFRFFVLGCIARGINQKPGALFSWDVDAFQRAIAPLWNRSASLALIGGTAIILRQVFAARGQALVGRLARALHRGGRVWDRLALRDLHRRLRALGANDSGRRTGRLVAHSGPAWVKELLGGLTHDKWIGLCGHVGNIFSRAPAVAGSTSLFFDVCRALIAGSGIPGMGRYSVISLVRSCCSARLLFDGVRVEPCELAWERYVRSMHPETTARMFDNLGVETLADAGVMRDAVVSVGRSMYSTRIAANFGKLLVSDMALLACESTSVLNAARKADGMHSRLRGSDASVATWCMGRWPADIKGMSKMARKLRLRRSRAGAGGGGIDPQSAGLVAATWVRDQPEALRRSLLDAMHGSVRVPWTLTPATCASCGGSVSLEAQASIVATRRALCRACSAVARRDWDRQRQQRRRVA